MTLRPDQALVASLVPAGARVLDLGCGDGALLAELIDVKGCSGWGVEISDDGFHACVARGVPVVQDDLDRGLTILEEGEVDVVVLSETIQALHRPAFVLGEMRRVAPRGIVSLPNFGHWRLRAQLAFGGRMPRSAALPHAWHDTPNIHLCTLRDFEALLEVAEWRTTQRVLLDERQRRAPGWVNARPNLLAGAAVYALERG
jgi:methionine biosynthesis protein MetW